METINKRHDAITSNQRVDLASYFKLESDKAVYFSAGAGFEFGLIPGLYIHFMNDGDKWFFYCNDDTDGFKLIARPGKNSVLVVSASLVKLIQKRTCCSIGSKFLVTRTNSVLKGQHIIEINFNRLIE